MTSQTYEQGMRQEARRLIAEHGSLIEVRCVSGPPDYRIELQFADGHQEVVTRHSGRIDISMMKFGYAGTGTTCLWTFLDEAGFKDISLEQLQTMRGPQVLRKGRPPETPAAQEQVPAQQTVSQPGEKPEAPMWEDLARDPSLLHPLVLEQLQKSLCVIVRDETGPVAAMVLRASPDEFHRPVGEDLLMSLYIHPYRSGSFELYGVYPMVWDDPGQPFFKETWLVGAGTVTGPSDPLSENQLSSLLALLTQEYTYFLILDPSYHVLATRKVHYSPTTQEYFLSLLPGARAAREATISNAQFIYGVGEYLNNVSLEEVREAAGKLHGIEAGPGRERAAPAVPPPPGGERTYPWRGKSVLRRVGTLLLALVWFFLCSWAASASVAMQGVELNWLLSLLIVFFVLVVPASCLVDALLPTRIRELVVSPKRGVIFRRKSGQERPIFAQLTRIAEPKQGKRILLHGRSPEGKYVRAEINRANLPEGDFEKLKQDLRGFAPSAQIEVVTRRVLARRVLAAICSIPATLALLAALFLAGSLIYDHIQGTISLPVSLRTAVAVTIGAFVLFFFFAAVSTLLSDRRKNMVALWMVFLVLGLLGTGAVVRGITGGDAGDGGLSIIAPLATRLAPGPAVAPGSAFADQIIASNPGRGQNQQYSDPSAALGSPDLVEQPCCSGMLQLGAEGSVLLAFTDNIIYDGPGPDFQVYGESARDDFIVVEISADGQTWHTYPKTDESPEPFDLTEAGLEEAVFVRITDVQPGTITGAELDAVEAIHNGPPQRGGLPQNLPDALARVDVTLREGPGESSPAVDEVEADSTLEILGCSQDSAWTQVQTVDGQQGWCATAQLALNVSLADYRAPQPAPVATSPPPTPAPATLAVQLGDALANGLAQAGISGQGLEWIDLVLESLSAQPLEVTISAGTVFQAQTGGVQNMVVRRPRVVLLPSLASKQSLTLSVACANMELNAPEEDDSFAVSTAPVPEDLIKLLNLPGFLEESFRVQQFAIWTITDNPPRGGYVGLGYSGVGSGPSDEEMQSIRALFQQAGIPTERYQALQ